MSKLVQATVSAAALALNTNADTAKSPFDGASLPPADPHHVLKVDRPAYLLAQAQTPAPSGFTVTTTPVGALNPEQEKEFAAMTARIHKAHLDNYIAKSLATDITTIYDGYQESPTKGRVAVMGFFYGAGEKKTREDKDGSLAAAKKLEADFASQFGAQPTKLAQYNLLKPYLQNLEGETAALNASNAAGAEKVRSYMKPVDVEKFNNAIPKAVASQTEVYNEQPKAPNAPKGKKH